MVEIIIPRVGETTGRVRIVRWLKAEGEAVKKDEPLLEVETDKANLTIEAYADGVLQQIIVPEGEEADALQVVGVLSGPEGPTETAGAAAVEKAQPVAEPVRPKATAPAIPGRQRGSPLARRIAAELRVDLSEVVGTGPGGLVTAEDVRAAAERAAAPVPTSAEPAAGPPAGLSRMRRRIGERMSQSKARIPHFYVATHVDMHEASKLRTMLLPNVEARAGVRLSHTHLLIKALGLAAEQSPKVNSTYVDGVLTTHKEANVGLAVALDEGLVVPVLKDAGRKSLAEIAVEADDLAKRAREGRLTTEQVQGGTITLTNLGSEEVEFFVAIINPPECAIVATGQIIPRAVVQEGQVVVHPTMFVVASGDHRVLDGAVLARFLRTMKGLLEAPYQLLAQV